MRTIRLHQAVDMILGETITLDKAAQHYLRHVLRCRSGDDIVVFNGHGGEYAGCVAELSKQTVKIKLKSFNENDYSSPLSLHLAQALVASDKMDLIIQKAVELGVSSITPIYSERSAKKLPADRLVKRMQHWRGVIISACEQCGRNRLMQLHSPIHFEDWVNTSMSDVALIGDPAATTRLADVPPDGGQSLSVTIGAEGGLSQSEVTFATSRGFEAINLSPRVLRTETAAIATITLIQHLFGDM